MGELEQKVFLIQKVPPKSKHCMCYSYRGMQDMEDIRITYKLHAFGTDLRIHFEV